MIEKEIRAVLVGEEGINGVIHLDPLRGPNGYSAYELYVQNLPQGETPLSEQEWLDSLNKANYYKQYKATFVINQENQTTIPIPINEYNETCLLDVYVEGFKYEEMTQYTIDPIQKTITFKQDGENIALNIGTRVHFVCSRTVVATANDYDLLRGTDGIDVTSATSGTPIQSNDYTVTPITFNKSDNTAVTVNVQAKNGINGEGVPDGGTTGQVLAKASDTNQDVEWINRPTIIDNLDGNSSINAPSQNAVNQGLLSINNFIGDLFKFQTLSVPIEIAGNGHASFQMGWLDETEGYSYLGILSKESGFGDQWTITYSLYQGNKIFADVRNNYSQTLSSSITCTVIYIKSDYLSTTMIASDYLS